MRKIKRRSKWSPTGENTIIINWRTESLTVYFKHEKNSFCEKQLHNKIISSKKKASTLKKI